MTTVAYNKLYIPIDQIKAVSSMIITMNMMNTPMLAQLPAVYNQPLGQI